MLQENDAVAAEGRRDSSGGIFQIVYLCNTTDTTFKLIMFKALTNEIRGLHLPKGSFAIFGSGPMAVHNLKEPNDIDLIVTKDIYALLKNKRGWTEKAYNEGEKYYLEKNSIEVWDTWGPGNWDIPRLIETAELIDGLPYVTLGNVLMWKKRNGRPKDAADIKKSKNI